MKEPSNGSTKQRFITFRHNLRAICNIVLFHLGGLKIHDQCGINMVVHHNGSDIFLENVIELETKRSFFAVDSVYGYVLEHLLDCASKNEYPNDGAMDYRKCVDRTEIRALNRMHIGSDIECLCAAEMDAVLRDDASDVDGCQVIEIKSNRIRSKNSKGTGGKCTKIKGIMDKKLLKYWTQCRFGGVDAVLIAFHRDGLIERTEMVKTSQLEAFFPNITRK